MRHTYRRVVAGLCLLIWSLGNVALVWLIARPLLRDYQSDYPRHPDSFNIGAIVVLILLLAAFFYFARGMLREMWQILWGKRR